MNELISIIIPVFNKKDYIRNALHSCQNQSYSKLEVIMIDDGSTDGSSEICKEFAKVDKRFEYYHQENKGASYSRNRGIEIAKGDWIVFLDADDALAIDYCEKCLAVASRLNVDMLIISSEDIDEKNTTRIIQISEEKQIIWSSLGVIDLQILMALGRYKGLNYNYTLDGPCCKIIKRQIVKQASFPENLDLGEDTCFVAQLLSCANSVAFYNDVLYNRNIVANSLSYVKDINKVNRVVDYVCWLLEYWKEMLPINIQRRFVVRVYSTTLLEYLSYDNVSLRKRKKIIKEAFNKVPIKFPYVIYMKPVELICNAVYTLNSNGLLKLIRSVKRIV